MTSGDLGLLSGPEALAERHVTRGFESGEPTLDNWLVRRALANNITGASRTFVICREERFVGYYALAAGGIASSESVGRLRRNMPDPIPIFILGRLAVAKSEQGQRLGSFLLRDAILKTRTAAQFGGIAGIVVHALSDEAKRFYQRWGFAESPANPMTLMATMKDLAV